MTAPLATHTATALVLEAPDTLRRRTFPLPAVGDADGLLEVEACGLCGTDHQLFTGEISLGHTDFIPGHETVGRLVAAGPEAERVWGVRVGDRVAVDNRLACRTCDRCAAGAYAACRNFGTPAESYGLTPVSTPPSLLGGYATHHYLRPESVLHKVPETVDPADATLFNPFGAGIDWGVTIPGTRAGETVAVLGPGIRGLAVLAAVKAAGARYVMVTGYGERDRSRLELATKLGADLVVDVSTSDPAAILRATTGRLADVVVEVTAGPSTIYHQAVTLADAGGRVVLAGTGAHGGATDTPDPLVAERSLSVVVANAGVTSAARSRALELLAEGRLPTGDLPRQVAGFDGMADLLYTMAGRGKLAAPVHAVFIPDA